MNARRETCHALVRFVAEFSDDERETNDVDEYLSETIRLKVDETVGVVPGSATLLDYARHGAVEPSEIGFAVIVDA